ncbi:baseplate J/gp47 family protein [Megasphaera paucivorans]|uniref:Uncharacterized phage protein gp47/JayE n=1 Tax=Megasphaera paucivorans TaxID=349095 RepID=A0A1G9QW35_9FIRM|nr:baseplate J/gp47 family protein [Megasphaera paucivorans]SDM15242.1 Uncharacterized phage protein gp47/JayE [Megasphaera paucivorans]
MYSAREQADILEELQNKSTIAASKFEGTFEYDIFSSNSIEFAKTEVELEQLYKAAFADTSWGDYLTMRAAESGIIRKDAVHSIGNVIVKGTGTLPTGSIFATKAGTQFKSLSTVSIVESATIAVQAVIAGEAGNVSAGEITLIPMSIPGINSVINEEAMHDGYDEENDSSLLSRYLVHVRTPGTSGNKYHYLEWATSVSGVSSAKVIPLWNGAGTVKVVIVNNNYEQASDTLVKSVADYIETVRPIGATVTVTSAAPKMINISATIDGTLNESTFKENIKNYFITIEKNIINSSDTGYVSIAKIGAIILSDNGVNDYSNLKINGESNNIALTSEEIATLGTVTLS